MTEINLPAPPARVHFIGIGGIGMSGLAAVLHDKAMSSPGPIPVPMLKPSSWQPAASPSSSVIPTRLMPPRPIWWS